MTCPKCNQDALNKLVSAPSFRLSGSGWYETDFKTDKDKKKNLAGDAGKQKAPSDPIATGKNDAPKAETKATSNTESKTKTPKSA